VDKTRSPTVVEVGDGEAMVAVGLSDSDGVMDGTGVAAEQPLTSRDTTTSRPRLRFNRTGPA